MKRILALGGGGFLMENRHSPIDQYIVKLAGKVRPRICFVSTPNGDLPEGIDRFYEAYGSLDCEPSHLAFFRKPGPGAIGVPAVPVTAVVGVKGWSLVSGLLPGEVHDGVVTVSEASAPWLTDVVRVPVTHTFLPSDTRVTAVILERLQN